MRKPPVETANVIDIDYSNNPDLQEIFASKDAGDECRLTLDLQVLSRSPDGIRLGINKVTAEGSSYDEDEAEPDSKQPIIMTLRDATKNERMGYKGGARPNHSGGAKGEVPETVENSLGLISNA